MARLSALFQTVALITTIVLVTAAPQSYPPYMDAQTSYDALASYPSSTPGYWQAQGAEPSAQYPPGGQRDNSMVTFTTGMPKTPEGPIPFLNRGGTIGEIPNLPYPNFSGFPLYPFTPYFQGQWWR